MGLRRTTGPDVPGSLTVGEAVSLRALVVCVLLLLLVVVLFVLPGGSFLHDGRAHVAVRGHGTAGPVAHVVPLT